MFSPVPASQWLKHDLLFQINGFISTSVLLWVIITAINTQIVVSRPEKLSDDDDTIQVGPMIL